MYEYYDIKYLDNYHIETNVDESTANRNVAFGQTR